MAAPSLLVELRHSVQPAVDRLRLSQGPQEPRPEQSSTHRSEGAINHRVQRGTLRVVAQRLHDLEVPPRHHIQVKHAGFAFDLRHLQLTHTARLHLQQIRE